MTKLNGLVVMIFSLFAIGCSSIIDGTTQSVTLNSEPDGAEILINGIPKGTTPLTLHLEREWDVIVVAQKDGFYQKDIKLETTVNPWFWGNIITGGLFGSTTDSISGAMIKYSPDEYFITLQPQSVSQEEEKLFEKRMWTRNFILLNHDRIGKDLAMGDGEYLSSLNSIFKIEPQKRDKAIEIMKDLFENSRTIPDFAKAVLDSFGSNLI